MVQFGCTSVTSEEVSFRFRIENFSMRPCGGSFASPEFGTGTCRWCLFVDLDDRQEEDGYVVVRLNRSWGSEELEQFVRAKLSVVDVCGSPCFTKQKEIYFQECTDAQEVLVLSRRQLHGTLGLNKPFLLPHDVLTLACELDVCREVVETSNVREERVQGPFEESGGALSSGHGVSEEYFGISRLDRRNFRFCYRFRDLSTLRCKGRLLSAPFRGSDGGEWTLVLDTFDEDGSLEVALRRNHPEGKARFVDAKLSVVRGRLPVPFPVRKRTCFHGDRDEQKRLMTIGSRDWAGLKKLLLTSGGDSLTLHVEIAEYGEIASLVDCVPSSDENFRRLVRRLTPPWLVCLLLLSLGLAIAYFLYYCVLLPFVDDYLLPFAGLALKFVAGVGVFWYALYRIRCDAEKLMEAEEKRQNRKNRSCEKQRFRGQQEEPRRHAYHGNHKAVKWNQYH